MTTAQFQAASADATRAGTGGRGGGHRHNLRALRDLAIDLGIPLGSYYVLRDGVGVSMWLALAASSIGPAIRSARALGARHELNPLAALMLLVNAAGIVVSFLTGDPRAMIAKDSLISSVIGVAMLGSVAVRRPLLSPALRLWLTKGGDADREATWDRLRNRTVKFRRLECLFTVIWGVIVLAECVIRVAGAYTLPISTMVWLSTVLVIGAIGLACAAGGLAAVPMLKMMEHELASDPAGPAVSGVEQLPVPFGDDLNGAVDDRDGRLIVYRVGRHR